MEVYRPVGVIIFSAIFIILAFLELVFGVLMGVGLYYSYYMTVWGNVVLSIVYMPSPPIPMEFGTYFMLWFIFHAFWNRTLFILLRLGAFALLIGAVLHTTSGIGLLFMRKWGYYLALITGILDVVGGFTTLFALPLLIFGIGVIVYLLTDVKYYFE
ncbi:MAG: hypothetical protein ACUVXA_17410 [Candidatus Jordarchaeum sp.]|uniref:hypothetical protein n=1 Tax=Candidatus Jordarchaeum sp. TaxID=2823881 RepID=UPI00404A8160